MCTCAVPSKMVFGLKGFHMTTTLPQDQQASQESIGINPELNAGPTMVLAPFMEDSSPQAILKFPSLNM